MMSTHTRVILLAILAIILTGCSMSEAKRGAPRFQSSVPLGRSKSDEALKMNTFTLPSTSVPNVMAPQPQPSGIVDFSSASLDWEDAYPIIKNCSLLNLECKTELEKAVFVEMGWVNDVTKTEDERGEISKPGSRVYLCWHDPACKKDGYGSYQGTVPLPTFVPSVACQQIAKTCYYANPQHVNIDFELLPPVFPDCDVSDRICEKYNYLLPSPNPEGSRTP